MCSIHPDKINLYHEVHWHPFKPTRNRSSIDYSQILPTYEHLLQSERTAGGLVSKVAKRKIVKAINYLLTVAQDKKVYSQKTGRSFKFKIAFITLTLPAKQRHSDQEIKRELLNQFLTEITKYHGVKRYVWRAEKQKNGNIHFHILTDKFIHWNDIRNRWNRILRKLDYVQEYQRNMLEFYKDGFRVRNELIKSWSETRQRAAWRLNMETGYNNPNTTDIHSIQKIRNITAYFIKYMTQNTEHEKDQPKNTEEEPLIGGRIWGASKNLLNIKGAQMVVDNELEEQIERIKESKFCKVIIGTYYSVLLIDWKRIRLLKADRIFNEFIRYLGSTFDYEYQYSTAV
jgi:hypothetical protein